MQPFAFVGVASGLGCSPAVSAHSVFRFDSEDGSLLAIACLKEVRFPVRCAVTAKVAGLSPPPSSMTQTPAARWNLTQGPEYASHEAVSLGSSFLRLAAGASKLLEEAP